MKELQPELLGDYQRVFRFKIGKQSLQKALSYGSFFWTDPKEGKDRQNHP